MYMYKLIIIFVNSYWFLGQQCIRSVKVQGDSKQLSAQLFHQPMFK